MYGINQISKAAQSRNDNNTMSGRSSPDQYYEQRDARAVESNNNRYLGDSYLPPPRHAQYSARNSSYYPTEPTSQRRFLEGQAPYDGNQQYYAKEAHDCPPQYEYAGSSRSTSAPPPQSNHCSNRQRGFVEPEEIMGDPREQQGGSRSSDMMSTLAQQAINMGLGGNNHGRKEKKSKGDLIQSLMGK